MELGVNPDPLAMSLATTWRHLESVSFDAFKRSFQLQTTHAAMYPILDAILRNENMLHKIRYIVDIFAWQAIAFKVINDCFICCAVYYYLLC